MTPGDFNEAPPWFGSMGANFGPSNEKRAHQNPLSPLHTSKCLTCILTFLLFPCFSSALQTKLLTQYILNLGKYDQSYDIRDRTRFIRQLIVPNEKSGALNKYARRILLAPKPAPVLESTFKGISYISNANLLSILSDILASLNESKV